MELRRIFSSLAVVALLATTACASTANDESTGQVIDSTVISTKVRAAIAADDQLSIIPIDVTTFKDVVQLSGFVDSAAHKQRAGEIAAGVEGVKEVRNNLVIKGS